MSVDCKHILTEVLNFMAKAQKKVTKKVEKNSDIPATRGQLDDLRSELKSDIRAMGKRLESKISGQDSKFASLESKISAQDAKFASLGSKISAQDAKFASLESKISGQDSKFASLESKISGQDSKFLSLESKIEALTAVCHRTHAIVEEQNARNQFVFDGFKGLLASFQNHEGRLKRLEKTTFGIES